MTQKWHTKEQLIELLCNLVKIPSVSGSDAEIYLSQYVREELGSLPYFQKHKDYLNLFPTGDGRYITTALVKKSEDVKNTVVLLSHFDVVDVEDYGTWKDHAFDSKLLTQEFYSKGTVLPGAVVRDMEKANWLFGRGIMDMKSGLTLHMAIIEQACQGQFDGNILLLTVPDEEVDSFGMRAAVPLLLDLAKQHNLEYTTVLNSEPVFPRYTGDSNQYIYAGTIGKVLPGFLCYGKETHVGEPFSGLSANYMASQVNDALELNTSFCELLDGEVTPPPINIMQQDFKQAYSVQISHRAAVLYNMFFSEKTINDITQGIRQVALQAAEKAMASFQRHAENFATLNDSSIPSIHINVYSYEELLDYAIKTKGEESVKDIRNHVLENRDGQDDREVTIDIVDRIAILCKELGPMIVYFFAPPFYPAVSSRHEPLISDVIAEMATDAYNKYDVILKKQNVYPGLSDLSYVGLQNPPGSLQTLMTHTPLWDYGYSLPLKEMEALDVPVLNFGPAGEDPHQWTERLDIDYSFGPFVDMLSTCIQKLLTHSSVSSKEINI